MKHFLIALTLACATTSTLRAAEPLTFSGKWKMNPAKSVYGSIPRPVSFVRKIALQGDAISIAEDQTGGSLDLVPIRRYIIDGDAATFKINGAEVVGEVRSDGPDLQVQSRVPMAGLEFNDRMSLSKDGNELISHVRIASDQGTVEMTVVFDRQP